MVPYHYRTTVGQINFGNQIPFPVKNSNIKNYRKLSIQGIHFSNFNNKIGPFRQEKKTLIINMPGARFMGKTCREDQTNTPLLVFNMRISRNLISFEATII